MRGTNIEAIRAVRQATTRRVTAAGGITTQQEIDELDALGVDAVVGMALYTGKLAFRTLMNQKPGTGNREPGTSYTIDSCRFCRFGGYSLL